MAGSTIVAPPSATVVSPDLPPGRLLTWAALIVALAALVGSLFLSLGMGLRACPLCFYQRTFVMSLVAVLVMGLATGASRSTLLALPLATAGLGVALFHVSLEITDTLQCPAGILGLGTAPQQSLALFIVLFGLLLIDLVRSSQPTGHTVAGLALGAVLAMASCNSNPPMPAPPKTAEEVPSDICWPPFRGGPR